MTKPIIRLIFKIFCKSIREKCWMNDLVFQKKTKLPKSTIQSQVNNINKKKVMQNTATTNNRKIDIIVSTI